MKIVLLIFLFIVTISLSFREPPKIVLPEKPIEIIEPSVEQVLDSIWEEILILNLDYPEIVFSQVLLETGYLSSDVYKNNNNLFGMRRSGSRATTSNIVINGYKWYPNWRESLLDYALLQMAFYKGKTKQQYFDKLGRVYAEDPFYTNKLKIIKERLQNPST